MLVFVAMVRNGKVMAAAEDGSHFLLMADQVLITHWNQFLKVVQLHQKGFPLAIFHVPAVAEVVPGIVSVPCNGLSELSANQSQGVRGIVALQMEGLSVELMLGSSEQELEVLGLLQSRHQELYFLEHVLGLEQHV